MNKKFVYQFGNN